MWARLVCAMEVVVVELNGYAVKLVLLAETEESLASTITYRFYPYEQG